MIKSFLFVLPIFICAPVYSHDLDSILDKLEHKLMENENNSMSSAPERKNKEPHYHTKSKTITPPGTNAPMRDIENNLKHLDHQIGLLEKDIEIMLQQTLQQAKSKNIIKITANIIAEGSHQFSNISVELDEQKIYYSDTKTGFWIPDDHLPIYWGTLSPGLHVVKITARIHRVAQTTHPIRGEKLIQKNFKVQVPNGPYEKEWRIVLQPDEEASQGKEAILVEEELS